MTTSTVISIFMLGALVGVSLYQMYRINRRVKVLEDKIYDSER